MKHILFVILVFSTSVSFGESPKPNSPTPENRFPLLAALSIPADELPAECSIPKDPKFPIEGAKNRQVTTDPRAFVFLGDRDPERDGIARKIEAAYFSVYQEKSEIGVMAWSFDTPASAKIAYDTLVTKKKDRFRVWQKEKVVILLWRDRGTTDKCYQTFADFIQKKIGAAAPPAK